MKKRKMTKRQLLNALLDNDETKRKLYESQKRIWSREEKLDEHRQELSEQLSNICYKEQHTEGKPYPGASPIVFKKHVFKVRGKTGYRDAGCDIEGVNSVS